MLTTWAVHTEPSFTRSVHLTFSSITMVFVSLALASLALKENRRGSARMGTRPKRWDRTWGAPSTPSANPTQKHSDSAGAPHPV
eukprot:scaffold412_cov388-Prasinococcus_capsulatus_cf.AAC.32